MLCISISNRCDHYSIQLIKNAIVFAWKETAKQDWWIAMYKRPTLSIILTKTYTHCNNVLQLVASLNTGNHTKYICSSYQNNKVLMQQDNNFVHTGRTIFSKYFNLSSILPPHVNEPSNQIEPCAYELFTLYKWTKLLWVWAIGIIFTTPRLNLTMAIQVMSIPNLR